MTANYMMLTIAACEASYLQEAFGHAGKFVGELKEKAGCVGARYGVVATGSDAGSFVLFQSYAQLGDIDKAFGVYASSTAYQTVIKSGKINVTLRNIVKLEDVQVSKPSTAKPGYGVVTLVTAPTLTSDRLKALVPIYEKNGAMLMRYGTLITGSNAGKRLLGVTFPSMDAIEKTYDGLRSSGDYQKLMSDIKLDRREIVRFAG